MDDMGWSDPGCYGSEIDTPNIDALAARGVRLTHYTTHAICSPARAALLTGCNAHGVGTGWLANNHPGYPGYSGELPMDAATLPETLREAGYAIEGSAWYAFVGPAGMSVDVATKLNTAFVAAIRSPATAERMRGMGVEPTGTTREALAAILKADYERWGAVIKASGFRADD
jgi:hypothetical protein